MTDLHYTSKGSGRPLLILHGLFGSSKNWQTHASQYAEQFQVVNVDLRNHGQSFHHAEMNYAVMADDVAALIEHLELGPCQLLGHSMGGKVAMTLALRQRELVDRLVIADIAPMAYFHDYDDLLEPIMALSLQDLQSRAQADQLLRSNIPEDQLRAFLLQNLVRQDEKWQWRVNWSAIKANMRELTGFDSDGEDWRIDIPTVFIRGALSDYIGEAETALISAHFSQAEIITLKAAGHWLHAEQPAAFSEQVMKYLNR